jgi:hypothetical protein
VKIKDLMGHTLYWDNNALHTRNRSGKARGDHRLVGVSTAAASQVSQTKNGRLLSKRNLPFIFE